MHTLILQAFADLPPQPDQPDPFPWSTVLLSAWVGSIIGYLLGSFTRLSGERDDHRSSYMEGFYDGVSQPPAPQIKPEPRQHK